MIEDVACTTSGAVSRLRIFL